MIWEAAAALVVGLAVLALVLYPLAGPWTPAPPRYEPEEQEETAKGMALAALREIEFDRETGKLSDDDYDLLKSKYSAIALDALRGGGSEIPASAGATMGATDASRSGVGSGEFDGVNARGVDPAGEGTRGGGPDGVEALIAARVRALRAARTASAGLPTPSCSTCGPRSETDAIFCSSCGLSLGVAAHACPECAVPLAPGSRFCESCGTRVAA